MRGRPARIAVLGPLLLLASGLAVAALSTRVFTIHHKDLDDVVTLIRPAVSDDASILIQPKLRTVSVTDHAENLDSVRALIAAYDLPPRSVGIQVQLVRATRGGPGPRASVPRDRIPPSLREITRWLDYDLIGSLSLTTAEAERSNLALDEEYRVRFQVDQVDDRVGKIRLREFVLERRTLDRAGRESWVPIFDTVVQLRSGTPYVFGATRGQDSQRALFLTITADIVP